MPTLTWKAGAALRANALILLAAACLTAFPTSSSQAMTYDLQAVGLAGSGFITFDTATYGLSSTDPASVIDFSLSGTGPLGAYAFDESSITSPIDWSIDPGTWVLTLTVLTLSPTTVSNLESCIGTGGVVGCGFGSVDIFGNPFGIAQMPVGSGSSTGVAFSLTATPVPEPASLALIASGLLGLGWAGRRRRAEGATSR